MTGGTHNSVYWIVKLLLLGLPLLSLPAAAVHLSFNSTLQLINGILSDLQNLLKYFNGTAIVQFFRVPLVRFGKDWATVFYNNLAL